MSDVAPTLVASRTALPPEGAAAPAARRSRFRGPGWCEAALVYSLCLDALARRFAYCASAIRQCHGLSAKLQTTRLIEYAS